MAPPARDVSNLDPRQSWHHLWRSPADGAAKAQPARVAAAEREEAAVTAHDRRMAEA